MTTARATSPLPRTAPAPDRRRPVLRVVDTRRDGSKRNTAHVFGTVLATVLFLSVFSVVICQVLLVQTQGRLDDINAQVEEQVATEKQLRHETAALESPEHVVTEATNKLGMVQAPGAGYLQPRPDDDARAALSDAERDAASAQDGP